MNKRLYVALAAAIIVIVVALIVTNTTNAQQAQLDPLIGKPVPASVMAKLSIPNSVSNKIGIGSVQYLPQKVTTKMPLLTNDSKPEVLYVGAEYCPYCAITRWGMIIALMRFGNFTNLHYMASNSSDVFPNTPTFDFANATYTSPYVSFVSVETTTRNRNVQLQSLTPSQNNIFTYFNPQGGIPFVNFGNQSLQLSAPVLPTVLQGKDWNWTIANLTNTSSSTSQALVGSADVFTAEICMLTNDTPQSVCGQPYVSNIERNVLG